MSIVTTEEMKGPDIQTFQEGLLLVKDETTLLSKFSLDFPLKLEINLPRINVEYHPKTCPYKEKDLLLYNKLRTNTKTILLNEFSTIFNGRVTAKEILHRVDTVMSNLRIGRENTRAVKNLRARRAFQYLADDYFTLSGWTEDKLKENKDEFQRESDILSQKIQAAGLAITANTNNLDNISKIICGQQVTYDNSILEIEIQMKTMQAITYIADQIDMAEQGQLPTAINNRFLGNFCKIHFRQNVWSKFCENMQIRQLFSVKLRDINLNTEKDSIVLQMDVSCPETENKNHEIFRVFTLPITTVNARNEATEWKIENSIKFLGIRTQDEIRRNNFAGFRYVGCFKHNGIEICEEQANDRDVNCLFNIINGDKEEAKQNCNFSNRPAVGTCSTHRLKTGVAVSTLHPLTIHYEPLSSNENNFFTSQNRKCQGMCFIEREKRRTKYIICKANLIKISSYSENMDISIKTQPFNNENWNYTAKEDKTIMETIKIAKQEMQTMKNITMDTNNIKDTITKQIEEMPMLIKLKYCVFMIIGLVILMIIIVLLRIIFQNIQKCRAMRRVPV